MFLKDKQPKGYVAKQTSEFCMQIYVHILPAITKYSYNVLVHVCFFMVYTTFTCTFNSIYYCIAKCERWV